MTHALAWLRRAREDMRAVAIRGVSITELLARKQILLTAVTGFPGHAVVRCATVGR